VIISYVTVGKIFYIFMLALYMGVEHGLGGGVPQYLSFFYEFLLPFF
jgi:hypothetical protein